MQELEKEIKKLAPSGNFVDIRILSKATNTVNEKIRNQGLSAKEMLFSRDQFSQKNLELNDESISKLVTESRKENNFYSSKSKSTTKKAAIPANAKKGNVVFLKHDGNKHFKRDLYLVIEENVQNATVDLCKISGLFSQSPASFQPHVYLYKVKQTDIYLAPNQPQELDVIEEYIDPYIEFSSEQYSETEAPWSPSDEHRYKNRTPVQKKTKKHRYNPGPCWEFISSLPDDTVEALDDQNAVQQMIHDDSFSENSEQNDTGDSGEEGDHSSVHSSFHDADTHSDLGVPFDPNEGDHSSAHSSFHDADTDSDLGVPFDQNDDMTQHRDLLDPNIANPPSLPNVGDRVAFIDSDVEPSVLVEATVTKMAKTVKHKWPEWINVQRDDRTFQTSFNINNTRWKRIQTEQALSSEDEIADQFACKNTWSSSKLDDTRNGPYYEYVTNIQVTIANDYYKQNPEEQDKYIRMQDLAAKLDLEIPENMIIENRVYRLPSEQRAGSSILLRKQSKWSTFYQRLRGWLSRIVT